MEIIIIVIVLAYILIKVVSFLNKTDNNFRKNNSSSHTTQNVNRTYNMTVSKGGYDDYYIGRKVIGLSARKGYQKFQIAGAYYRNLPIEMIGRFNGYAIAEADNQYDPVAIAIYNDNNIHLGYLPKGNKALHSYILAEGGKVHAYGYLGYDNGMYGETCVEVDKNLVTKRNKPYAI